MGLSYTCIGVQGDKRRGETSPSGCLVRLRPGFVSDGTAAAVPSLVRCPSKVPCNANGDGEEVAFRINQFAMLCYSVNKDTHQQ
jgi:hypothetical protein